MTDVNIDELHCTHHNSALNVAEVQISSLGVREPSLLQPSLLVDHVS